MQPAAGAAAVGQLPSSRLASAARRRRSQQRHLVARVVSRYAAGAGAVPPSAAAPPPLPPAQQQAAQRPPVAPRRRVGVSVPPPSPVAPPGSSTLQSLTAAAGGAAGSYAQAPVPAQQPLTVNVQQAAALSSPAEVLLSRSQVMSKEVITRTSGRRLGYVQQMFVDPTSLAVVSLYLRRAANPIGAKNGEDHILLSSLRQISDVILVHNEDALLDPTADDTVGFYPMVGSAVYTQDGQELGKVRDFVFDPDTGAIGTVKYDKLGIPTLPQQLFDCYSIGYSDIVAVGPNRVIVRAGTAQRAIKENDGIVDNFGAAAVNLLTIGVFGGTDGEEKRLAAAQGDTSFRSDEGYIQWYEQYGRTSGMEPPGTPEYAAERLEWKRARGLAAAAPQPPPAARQQTPRALPPPQTATFAQAVQPQQAQQAASYQQAYQQQMFQAQRQAVPAGAAGGGWGAPPPAQQQQAAAPPPPYQQAYQAQPPGQPPYQAPPPQQAYQQSPAAAPAQQPPMQQQQYRPPAAAPQPPRPAAAAAPAAQQPPIPQNGIPIIDRTPLPPYRRRDADGNYGAPPAQQPAAARQQAPAQQQPPAPQRPVQPAPQRQPPPPAASASWGGSTPAQRAPQQPARMQQQAPVVVPDAVIIPGSVQQPTSSLGGGGVVGGPTRIAEFRQL